MKKLMTALCFILIFSMLLSPAAAADGKSTDTLVSWGIKITVPEGKTAILKGDEYYIYAKNEGSIPYVMVRVYDFGSEKEFISEFTKYMQKQYKDLKVTSKAAPKTVGDKDCWEIDYAYKVSGYDIADRRIVTTVGERTYMFASKEVASLGLTIGDMLEQVVADCEFLTEEPAPAETDGELADGYLYCLDNGMPKYWLDFTGAVADNLVLHCYFRGSDPTFYESIYILDVATADNTGDTLTIRKVCDSFGFDRSDWFKKLVIREDGNGLVMEVESRSAWMCATSTARTAACSNTGWIRAKSRSGCTPCSAPASRSTTRRSSPSIRRRRRWPGTIRSGSASSSTRRASTSPAGLSPSL